MAYYIDIHITALKKLLMKINEMVYKQQKGINPRFHFRRYHHAVFNRSWIGNPIFWNPAPTADRANGFHRWLNSKYSNRTRLILRACL